MLFNNNYNNFKRESLNKVIKEGIGKIRIDLTESEYEIWTNYSLEMLKIITQDKKINIYSDYFNFIQTLRLNTLPYWQKINLCVEYLIKINQLF